MYSGGYGFGNNTPNFNNATPQQQQQQQQMMYNQQQQFAGMAPQGNFPGASPQMMPGGMMQNAGMPHMGANGQMPGYQQQQQQQQQPQQQQQFAGSPYGQVPMNPQNFAPNNFMMGGGGMQGFPMQQQGMPQQQTPQMMQQRIQQQQANQPGMSQMSTPQRPSSSAQGTPSNAMPQQQQGQFQPPPQPQQQHQQSTPGPAAGGQLQQQPDQGVTPNTPTFPQNQAIQQGLPTASAVPMSPGTEARDKERFALLLDINHELLYESIQIQTSQQEIKKELAAEGKLTPDRKPTEEETILQQDYIQCMRRLQANLSYMATLADRKPDTKLPPCPAFLTAPHLTLTVKLRAQPIVPEGGDFKIDPVTDREERDLAIKELYGRLQACYPGIDPNKEPAFRAPGVGQKQPNQQGLNQPSPTTNKTPQMSNMQPPSAQG